MDYPAPIGGQLAEEHRCQNRRGPGGQRCQLLIDHDTCHSAAIGGTVYSWDAAGDAELPPGPRRWAPSFPRHEDG